MVLATGQRCAIKFSTPHATLLGLMLKPERLTAESRWAATAQPYEVGRLRCGAAPALACLPCVVLLTELAGYGIDGSSIGQEEARLPLRYLQRFRAS